MTETATLVRGVITNKLQSAKGNRFELKRLDNGNSVKVITFGKFDNNWLGEEVEFEAEYNSKYKNYNVKGDIRLVNETSDSPVPTGPTNTNNTHSDTEPKAVEPAKKRGRPAKSEVPVTETSGPTNGDISKAESLVLENLIAAKGLVGTLGLGGASVTDLVALADMIGRTKTALRIEAGKDRRMENFRKQ